MANRLAENVERASPSRVEQARASVPPPPPRPSPPRRRRAGGSADCGGEGERIPKAGFAGRAFDLRIVVIGGHPQHGVMRTSRGPLTNLHLGNRRGDLAALRRAVPQARWDAALETCRSVAGLFSGCLMLGVDLGLTPGFRRHFVIEVNAFGDLLPGVLHEGRDTYAAQVAAIG